MKILIITITWVLNLLDNPEVDGDPDDAQDPQDHQHNTDGQTVSKTCRN